MCDNQNRFHYKSPYKLPGTLNKSQMLLIGRCKEHNHLIYDDFIFISKTEFILLKLLK